MEEPRGYVDTQFFINHRHKDGSVEQPYEEATTLAKKLSAWIKQTKMPADSFLDAGCRTGYALDTLTEQFPAARVVGVDIVPQFVEWAEPRGEVYVADLHDLSQFQDREFDWVFCTTAIEHCYEVKKAASELFRVANTGVFIDTDLEDKARFDTNPSHFTYHNDPCEWIDEFRDPAFWLMQLTIPRYSRVEMTWVRREHVHDFNKEGDMWC